jgi:gamma-glutamylcyclotransferase (GGCT)/AIG2-like uncharacterized protein YtfP
MQPSTLFVYGILKRNFQLDLEQRGAKFLGEAQLPGAILYRIGHGGVGLRLVEDPLKVAYGEVFEIPDGWIEHNKTMWNWLDSIENNGLAYTRKVVQVCVTLPEEDGMVGMEMKNVWTYEHTFPGMKYDKPIESGRYEYVKGY